jgi:hypothetical protein
MMRRAHERLRAGVGPGPRAPWPGVALTLLALAGCAAGQAPPETAVVPPAAGAAGAPEPTPARPRFAVGYTASGGAIVSSATHPAVVDSGPSAEALAVLATIPEPVATSERVPPRTVRATASAAEQAARRAAAADSARGAAADSARAAPADSAQAAADSARATADSAGVPVPAPTEPLGDRPGTLARALQDTVPPPPPPPPAKLKPDSCWRVQIAAPLTREEADLKLAAAQSVLVVPMVIESEHRRFKVRTRDCMSREAALRLRKRAIASGLDGAFPIMELRK